MLIFLIIPNGTPKGIVETEHNSKWENMKYKNIDYLLTANQLGIITELIKRNQWIIEESNDLINMLMKFSFDKK